MAWPASTQTLADGLAEANSIALSVRNAATRLRDNSAAGPISAGSVLSALVQLNDAIGRLGAIATLPGIADYAKAEFEDPTLDVAGEFNALVAAMGGARDWIAANFPKDSGGYLLEKQFSGGVIVSRTFSTAQTAGLRTALDALIATVA